MDFKIAGHKHRKGGSRVPGLRGPGVGGCGGGGGRGVVVRRTESIGIH